MESRCWQGDEEVSVTKCKYRIFLSNTPKLLLVFHTHHFGTSPYLQKLQSSAALLSLESNYFSYEPLCTKPHTIRYALSVLPMKISFDFSKFSVTSALVLLQLPRILHIYNEKLPYNMPHIATQSKQLA